MAAQDPGELFDLCDAHGGLLGRSKRRADVHRDGDWHRSLHVWIVLAGGELLFQRRSREKDTWPGAVDVAVTGHYRAGESVGEALRECEEEVGLPLGVGDVVRAGTRRRVHRAPGVLDREVQEIYAAVTGKELGELRGEPDEVSGLIALGFDAARGVLLGRAESASGRELAGGSVNACVVRREEFIPDGDGYYARALESVQRVMRGERVNEWWVGEPE